jgi:hypothetical protein
MLHSNQIKYISIWKKIIFLILLSASLSACELNLFQSDCTALDKSISDEESTLIDEHQKLLDKIKNMYFNLGFKEQLSMATISTLADPGEDLVELATQYQEAINAMDSLTPEECKKKKELSKKRVSLLKAKLELQRKTLDERTTALIEETSDIPSR